MPTNRNIQLQPTGGVLKRSGRDFVQVRVRPTRMKRRRRRARRR